MFIPATATALLQLRDLLNAIKGDRSIRQFAEDSGVSFAYLAKILRGESIPSYKVIQRITDPLSNPQNGITYEQLSGVLHIIKGLSENNGERASDTSFVDFGERMMKGIILEHLSGSSYELVQNNPQSNREADLMLKGRFDDGNNTWTEWAFVFKYKPTGAGSIFSKQEVEALLGRYLLSQHKKTEKWTIVVNKESIFDCFEDYKNKVHGDGLISVMLIDVFEYNVQDEMYLSESTRGRKD